MTGDIVLLDETNAVSLALFWQAYHRDGARMIILRIDDTAGGAGRAGVYTTKRGTLNM